MQTIRCSDARHRISSCPSIRYHTKRFFFVYRFHSVIVNLLLISKKMNIHRKLGGPQIQWRVIGGFPFVLFLFCSLCLIRFLNINWSGSLHVYELISTRHCAPCLMDSFSICHDGIHTIRAPSLNQKLPGGNR